jgi:hypothetical protein
LYDPVARCGTAIDTVPMHLKESYTGLHEY